MSFACVLHFIMSSCALHHHVLKLAFVRDVESDRIVLGEGKGAAPLSLSNSGSFLVGGAPPLCGLVCLPPIAHMAHIFPRGVPATPLVLRYVPDTFRNTSRCPNNTFQYINLYVSTISRLLVMSVITSGTPNNLRYIKSHKLIIPIVIKR